MSDGTEKNRRPKSFLGKLSVIIVNHNNSLSLESTLLSVFAQTWQPDRILVVDCASIETNWRNSDWANNDSVECFFLEQNLGFTGGNNLAWARVRKECDWVLFLNPDVTIPEGVCEQLRGLMLKTPKLAIISPRLMSYDLAAQRQTGGVDSSGIFPSLTGWADRRTFTPSEDRLELVPALCGAFMLCRVEALRAVERPTGGVFDERYFAYKEDIELSLRLRRAGWSLAMWHGGEAYHERGWRARSEMPRFSRLLSARNEVRLHAAYAPLRLPVSVLKWLAVLILDL